MPYRATLPVRSKQGAVHILKTAIFRQINKANPHTHHDALEFPNGQIVLLTFLGEGQQATVLQLPTTAGVKAFRGEEPAYSDQVSGSR